MERRRVAGNAQETRILLRHPAPFLVKVCPERIEHDLLALRPGKLSVLKLVVESRELVDPKVSLDRAADLEDSVLVLETTGDRRFAESGGSLLVRVLGGTERSVGSNGAGALYQAEASFRMLLRKAGGGVPCRASLYFSTELVILGEGRRGRGVAGGKREKSESSAEAARIYPKSDLPPTPNQTEKRTLSWSGGTPEKL